MDKQNDEAVKVLSKSINDVVKIALSEAPFDVTVRGLIKQKLFGGFYVVEIDGNEYKVHSDLFFNEGDFVNILNPQNSPSNMTLVVSKPTDFGEHEHRQTTPLEKWSIVHNLNRTPVVIVTDELGLVLQPQKIEYRNKDVVIITFSSPKTGIVILR